MRIVTFLFTSLVVLLYSSACHSDSEHRKNKVYYVDSVNGNDLNSGTSPASAWASLQQVSKQVFQPGEKLLFKCGTSFRGQLAPTGSGTEENPIIIDSYGEGDKPLIEGNGEFDAAVKLYNVAFSAFIGFG